MDKNEWIKTFAFILLGIAIDRLFSPNLQVQIWLFSIFSIKLWGIRMDTLIYAVIAIAICVFLWRLERKKKKTPTLEDKLNAIINKLGISPKDIEESQKVKDKKGK